MAKTKTSVITEAKIRAICRSITLGASIKTAAACASIDPKTLYHWRKQGKKAKSGIYHELVQKMQTAEEQFIANNLENLARHANQSWQASAWLLERRHPEQFAKASERRELEELRRELELIRGEIAKHSNSTDPS
jgi:transposase-like protein